ncbi:PadR family transcriptional regulator [Actinomadura parmotrematis]|uniref:PadR family transcriptional regulator n=1 Tax=Actinomadura parmotrematis TaxID=2864039 RepID=A0ABS7FM56_9ACTN|nr:PadR family transcriptional regulator [Actinomadura parmotrematis]MBW8481460.1 PadR family transcriptional regulator [Actinomadura parmotrematis]
MSRPLTPLALAVLHMLEAGPMHPYEMQQRMRDHYYDHAVKVTHGSLYHTVERLAATGMIEPVETARAGRRPERTVYAITTAGRDAAAIRLADLLKNPVEEFPLYGTALAFAGMLPEDEVARQLRGRAVALEGRLASLRATYDSVREIGVLRHQLLDAELEIARVRAELEFTRGLAADLVEGRLSWKDLTMTHRTPRAEEAP